MNGNQSMLDRVLSFLKDLPGGSDRRGVDDDARIAASALLFHVMDVDGVRQDAEWERFKAGEKADRDAVDLYSFTSVLKRHLDVEARKAFVGLMWDVVYADGELHELEDNTVWRVAELIGVEREDRIAARRKAAANVPGATGASGNE
jgi:uncharacterized tellurite resistance protein B-like protein